MAVTCVSAVRLTAGNLAEGLSFPALEVPVVFFATTRTVMVEMGFVDRGMVGDFDHVGLHVAGNDIFPPTSISRLDASSILKIHIYIYLSCQPRPCATKKAIRLPCQMACLPGRRARRPVMRFSVGKCWAGSHPSG